MSDRPLTSRMNVQYDHTNRVFRFDGLLSELAILADRRQPDELAVIVRHEIANRLADKVLERLLPVLDKALTEALKEFAA